jgi:hypothetical protein
VGAGWPLAGWHQPTRPLGCSARYVASATSCGSALRVPAAMALATARHCHSQPCR